MKKKILIPIPSSDFDPTECAIPWKILTQNNVEIQFATPNGTQAKCDQRMLTGKGLGILAPFLMADKNGREAYKELEQCSEFQSPIAWNEIDTSIFDGVILPGGHAKGMKEYLESQILKSKVIEFSISGKPIGAICHGVVLAARVTINNESILKGKKVTALLYTQEILAWLLTFIWLGRYYRTYEKTVESEVKESLSSVKDFIHGPLPLKRDTLDHLEYGFTQKSGNYLTARWPGDAHRFSTEYLRMIK